MENDGGHAGNGGGQVENDGGHMGNGGGQVRINDEGQVDNEGRQSAQG